VFWELFSVFLGTDHSLCKWIISYTSCVRSCFSHGSEIEPKRVEQKVTLDRSEAAFLGFLLFGALLKLF